METTYDNLQIDFPEDEIARITLNRPERLNAMTYGLVTDLHGALDAIDNDHSTRAISFSSPNTTYWMVYYTFIILKISPPWISFFI